VAVVALAILAWQRSLTPDRANSASFGSAARSRSRLAIPSALGAARRHRRRPLIVGMTLHQRSASLQTKMGLEAATSRVSGVLAFGGLRRCLADGAADPGGATGNQNVACSIPSSASVSLVFGRGQCLFLPLLHKLKLFPSRMGHN